MNGVRIPVYQPMLAGRELAYVTDCLQSTWISSRGKYVGEFEREFSKFIGVNYAATVANGTVALHLALVALGLGPGDEVIVPTLTYIASVNAIAYTGATPVFVDSRPDTWQMDPARVEEKISPRTAAIMAVHLYGHPCAMDELTAIAEKYGLFLIEDCAEAFGAYYQGKHVGTFGDINTFSFFGNKTITTGEGGMVTTNDETLYRRICHYRSQGVADDREYWHDVIGYNYRMTNICAAIGLAQLEQAPEILKKKRQIARWYREGLKNLPLEWHEEMGDVVHSYWMCSVLVADPALRDALRHHLASAGIETRPLFYPVHTMPMYHDRGQAYPTAERLGGRGINLPSWPGLGREQVKEICTRIGDYYLSGKGSG